VREPLELGLAKLSERLAARLPDRRIPALEEGVCILRRLRPAGTVALPAWEPSAGPLKLLVAVGAPDEGQTPNRVLDLEAEVQAGSW
jgi:hypothetical protein